MSTGIGVGVSPAFRRGAPRFSPLSIAGCKLWLDAAQGVTLNGSNVSAWADQSGAGNHATQGTALRQPAYAAAGWSAGIPTVDFDASNTEWLSFAGTGFPADGLTVFCALSQTSTAARQAVIGTGDASSNAFLSSTNTSNVGAYHQGYRQLAAATTGKQALAWRRTSIPSGLKGWRGVASLGEVAYSPATTFIWTAPKVGSLDGATWYLNARVAEIIVYASSLSDANVAAVQAYLATRWGI
uniref:Uncharacterized protein n=1 Tax=viral metagenome TaxID=1070528 RepID=A0A6M3IKR0_9ZZZZ